VGIEVKQDIFIIGIVVKKEIFGDLEIEKFK
jgi:hypothetical protein